MKLRTSLLAVFLLVFSFIYAQKAPIVDGHNYESKASVLEKAHKNLDRFTTKYPFPKKHIEAVLTPYYENYEIGRSVIKKTTEKNSETQAEKLDSLENKYKTWRHKQEDYLESVQKKWDRLVRRYEFNDDYKDTFISYYFYKNYELDDTYQDNDFEALLNSSMLKFFSQKLAKAETDYVFAACTFDQYDSIRKAYGFSKLHRKIDSIVALKLKEGKDVYLERNTSANCKYVKNAIAEIEEKHVDKKKESQEAVLAAKAKEMGIAEAKVTAILNLIEKRNTDLKNLKSQQKQSEGSFTELFENTAVKTKSEIKKEFSYDLANLIDRKQFGALFEGVFVKNVKQSSTETLNELFANYEFSENQKKQVLKIVTNYHTNKEVITAYYYFDKKLKKQKRAALDYAFKKEFKKMMDKFNIPFKAAAPIRKKYTWK